MGRTKKLTDFEPLKSVTYHTEQHHTCNNSQICNKVMQPGEQCGNCKFYKFRMVDVADNPIRHKIDWGFDE